VAPRGTIEHPIFANGKQLFVGDIIDEKDFEGGTIESMRYCGYIEPYFGDAPPASTPPAPTPRTA
jgi:hypothetical protein